DIGRLSQIRDVAVKEEIADREKRRIRAPTRQPRVPSPAARASGRPPTAHLPDQAIEAVHDRPPPRRCGGPTTAPYWGDPGGGRGVRVASRPSIPNRCGGVRPCEADSGTPGRR